MAFSIFDVLREQKMLREAEERLLMENEDRMKLKTLECIIELIKTRKIKITILKINSL